MCFRILLYVNNRKPTALAFSVELSNGRIAVPVKQGQIVFLMPRYGSCCDIVSALTCPGSYCVQVAARELDVDKVEVVSLLAKKQFLDTHITAVHP